MSLNDTKIRSLKPSDKSFKISDSHGLYLLVNPGGSRLWYLKYRINGKESRPGLGAYPDVSLSDARHMDEKQLQALANELAKSLKTPEDLSQFDRQLKKSALR
ncbi:uncharacterized protein DUF4102 [Raoultella sp. BIGb0138]|nr:uncharacterized protein DUF4102 [Raoultella sp. BIGb0138]